MTFKPMSNLCYILTPFIQGLPFAKIRSNTTTWRDAELALYVGEHCTLIVATIKILWKALTNKVNPLDTCHCSGRPTDEHP